MSRWSAWKALFLISLFGLSGCGVKGRPIPYVTYEAQMKKQAKEAEAAAQAAPKKEPQ